MQEEDLCSLAKELVALLSGKGLKIATAESCTGGMLAQYITSAPGASQVFECGIVSYANRIKIKELGVSGQTLARVGAVSEETAMEMAIGVRNKAGSDVSVSTTGIAGPDGGTPSKPVGTVHIAACYKSRCLHQKLSLGSEGNRDAVRKAAVDRALRLVLRLLKED